MIEIIGKRVTAVEPLSKEELENLGWQDPNRQAAKICLDDDTVLLAMRDGEGNGPGCFFFYNASEEGRLIVQDQQVVIR